MVDMCSATVKPGYIEQHRSFSSIRHSDNLMSVAHGYSEVNEILK